MSYTGPSGKPPPKKKKTPKKQVAEGTVDTLKRQLETVSESDSAARKVKAKVIPIEKETERAEVPVWNKDFAVTGMCLHTCSLEYYGSDVRMGVVH